MTNPDLTLGTVLFWGSLGVMAGSWMRGRRDDREQHELFERRRRYANAVRGVPPLGDPDGGRLGD